MIDSLSPIIIGCTGGSGSRVVQHILTEAGIFMGKNLNVSRDAMDFEPFLDKYINPILTHTHSVNYSLNDLPDTLVSQALGELKTIIEHYIQDIPSSASQWGWKCPRNIYILPFIHALCPQMKFIHLVRDGRDMALSKNQNQLRKHYEAMFGKKPDIESPIDSITLWQKVNLDARKFGIGSLKGNYKAINFEALCLRPADNILALNLISARVIEEKKLSLLVKPPNSIGRYQSLNDNIARTLSNLAYQGLNQWGFYRQ